MTTHHERVARIATELRRRAQSREGFVSLAKAEVSHFVPNPHDPRHRDHKLDVRDLAEILEIDPVARTCTAEPGVAFCDLVRATLPHGLVPALVPELETITLGGAVAGCAVESMSFRRGGFHDSCIAYEVVTGTGEVIECSREIESDLFERMHGSYGTLGILSKLTFGLVPAKPFVHLEYLRFQTFGEFQAALSTWCQADDVDFVDAIIHSRTEIVLCLGRFTDHAPRPSSYTGVEIYYRSTLARREDFLTTYDYFYRYDTDCHWTTRTVPGLGSKLGRMILGPMLLGSTNLLKWSERLRPLLRHQKHLPVVIDLFIPWSRAGDFYDWYERKIGYYPLWIVPYRMPAPYPWIAPERRAAMRDDLFIDVAIYGLPNDRPGIDYSQMLEEKTYELGGIKTLISENHYSEETFWKIYDRQGYWRVKQRTDPHNLFRDVYQKFHFDRGRLRAPAPDRGRELQPSTSAIASAARSPR